jgi:hypothetical protein
MKRTITFILLGLLGMCLLSAQEVSEKKAQRKQRREARKALRLEKKETRQQENRLLIVGAGGSLNYLVDTRMAQNHYQGLGGSLVVENQHEKPRGLYDIRMAGFQLNSLSAAHEQSGVSNFRYDFRFSYLRNVDTLGAHWRWRLGGAADFTYNGRTHPSLSNDAYAHDLIGSLGMATTLDRRFRFLKRDWQVEARADLPLIAYVNRWPGYSLSGSGESQQSVKPIGAFNRFHSRFSIFKPFHKYTPNGFRISYHWDFYAFNDSEIHRVRVANQGLSAALIIHL